MHDRFGSDCITETEPAEGISHHALDLMFGFFFLINLHKVCVFSVCLKSQLDMVKDFHVS